MQVQSIGADGIVPGSRAEKRDTRTTFPLLMSPLVVAGHVLRNRVAMGSMHTRLENEPDGIERQSAFYAERAQGGVAMIVTGGFAPNQSGRVEEGAPVLDTPAHADALLPLSKAIRDNGALPILQILHAGRYAKHSDPVGASSIRSPINTATPRALTEEEIDQTIDDYVRCAELARSAGFAGVEIMGSEGYFINQFTAPRTNTRDDNWGGDAQKRMRLPVEIVRRVRARLGAGFLLIYRISALDLVEGGSNANEISELAKAIEKAGADILNTGVGWHEARVPTVAYFVPRAAWRAATRRVKASVQIPVMASNRINMPGVAEDILSAGDADLVSMARPLLADPEIVNKAAQGRVDEINTCIACNQACLDYIFREKLATCLVNPRAGRELEFDAFQKPRQGRRIAVIGAGAAGMACAVTAAERGHSVELFESELQLGGQLNFAARVPSKYEFLELKRYFTRRMEVLGVNIRLGKRFQPDDFASDSWDHIVVATGVIPRIPDIPGVRGANVVPYSDLLAGKVLAGRRVAIIGAGGIGFDVAAFLLKDGEAEGVSSFEAEWGIDQLSTERGGLHPGEGSQVPRREVYLLQRSSGRFGKSLGVSTGWILRDEVRRRGLHTLGDCEYRGIDAEGIELLVKGQPRRLEVETIVLCAGQESVRALYDEYVPVGGRKVHLIGGAQHAGELDALRAIDQGTRLALTF